MFYNKKFSDVAEEADPMLEMIGLKGISGLWVLGRP